jgi:hypothetical protein
MDYKHCATLVGVAGIALRAMGTNMYSEAVSAAYPRVQLFSEVSNTAGLKNFVKWVLEQQMMYGNMVKF